VDVIVCSASVAEHVGSLAGTTVTVLIDDRALDPRAVEMLAAVLVRQDGVQASPSSGIVPSAPSPRLFDGSQRRRRATPAPAQAT
jgi:hypothetical protein